MSNTIDTPDIKLTADQVEAIFMDCLFREGEPTDDAIYGEGVSMRVGFHPLRLAQHRQEIQVLLGQLPDEFMPDRGGGMSFLNACMTREGEQWGEHPNVDQLLALGIATEQVHFLIPRPLWKSLLGGMPYFVVSSPPSEDNSEEGASETVPATLDAPPSPQISAEERNFRWAYALLIQLAKVCLAEANAAAPLGEWPAQQTWDQLGPTSRSVFLREARDRAGIPHEEFLAGIRLGVYEVEDLFAATAQPTPGDR